jgi:hypothetical protein
MGALAMMRVKKIVDASWVPIQKVRLSLDQAPSSTTALRHMAHEHSLAVARVLWVCAFKQPPPFLCFLRLPLASRTTSSKSFVKFLSFASMPIFSLPKRCRAKSQPNFTEHDDMFFSLLYEHKRRNQPHQMRF